MPKKKDFTTADSAIDKFFSPQKIEVIPKHADDTDIDKDIDKDTPIIKVANDERVANKSKHFNTRGKRNERFGLLMDERLKEDLTHLSRAIGSKSVNDLIVTVLLDYVELEDNKIKLEQYRQVLER